MRELDMEALDNLLGSTKAMEKFNKWQLLELELRAIKFWDANYRANPNRDVNDIYAFQARQRRKEEILQVIGQKADS